MKHLTLTLIAVTVISGIAYYVLTHPNRAEVDRLRGELDQLEARNDALRASNTELEREVVALRDDPRLAERRARSAAGLAKPDELIFKFERPGEQGAVPVEVRLEVAPQKITLAGHALTVEDLPGELTELREQLPSAHLEVVFDEELGPIARQRIRDLVDASPLAPATYRDEK